MTDILTACQQIEEAVKPLWNDYDLQARVILEQIREVRDELAAAKMELERAEAKKDER